MLQDKIRSRYIPTWATSIIDYSQYFYRLFNRYPLNDPVNSLSCQPLFIVSSGRAGTTLLRSMLAVGEQIAIPPESIVIPTAIRRFINLHFIGWDDITRLIIALFESSRNFELWETKLDPIFRPMISLPESERSLARIIDEIFNQYLTQQFPYAKLWGDKSPINTLNLPRLFQTFPNGKYLHLVRDGRDVISSMLKKGAKLEYATSRWKSSVKSARHLQSKTNNDQFLEIRYENLVRSPIDTLNEICSFINIDYSDLMLDFWKSPTTIEHNYYDHHKNLKKPLFKNSIGVWSHRLSTQQIEYIHKKTQNLLDDLGYF